MLILLLGLIGVSLQFNLDTQSIHLLKSDNGLFGFTVALHKTSSENLILVGSPNAQTGVEGVSEGGAVFKCKVPRLSELQSVPVECTSTIAAFEDGGNKYYDNEGDTNTVEDDIYDILAENKSKQFLGVSMVASDEYVAVCAHRYEYRYWLNSLKEDLPRQLIGRCLVTDGDFGEFDRRDFKPCDNNQDSGYESYGYCQAGISVSLYGHNLVIGAPGRHRALGGGFLYNLQDLSDDAEEMIRISTPQDEDTVDKYIGYSTVTCNMDGDDDPDYGGLEMIFGGPRGEMYYGEIRIYMTKPPAGVDPTIENNREVFDRYRNEFDYQLRYNFAGEQMGSYFGHSLACTDINGDGYDDLVIGAPWYTDYTSDILADTGRIYVMYGSELLDDFDRFENPLKITGSQENAAFGFSLANGGDMNDDGYNDIFVGAPYHDDGEGAVFLYLGGKHGLQTFYSQIIKPSALNILNDVKTFGWSISGGKDMDGNGYPDVAIGAYKSGHVAFIRSKSVIDVEPSLDFKITEFSDTHQVTSLQVCLEYKKPDDRADPSIDAIHIELSISLDADNSRLSFKSDTKDKVWKETLRVSIKEAEIICTGRSNIHYDNSTGNVQPMPVVVSAVIYDPSNTLTSLVLNQEIINKAATELTIQSECHPDTGICIVDLSVEFDPDVQFAESNLYPTVVFGYVKSFKQMITVSNIGTAEYNYVYNAAVKLTFPAAMTFASVTKLNDDVDCYMIKEAYLLCNISDDGPINGESKSQTFGIEFDIPNITNPIDLVINAEVIVEDPTIDENDENNAAQTAVAVKELADLLINGGSTQSRVPFNNKYTVINRAIGSPDLDVKHEYSVELSEFALQADVKNISVLIYWPHRVEVEPKIGVYVVPLYNMSTRTPDHVRVYCRPDVSSLYPYSVGDRPSLDVADGLTLPVQERVDELPGHMSCVEDKSKCVQIYCNIDTISRGAAFYNGFKVSLHAKVHEANLYDSKGINITSFAMISGVLDGMELPLKRSASATTELYPSTVKSHNLLWIIIGAVVGGLLFLFLLILALWKCGFFKRKQPPSVRADKVDEQIDMTAYGQ